MFRQIRILSALAALALAGCVSVRGYSDAELSDVARTCGLAAGELVQEESYPKILFLYAVGPTAEQKSCVQKWARKRNLHLSYIDAIEFNADAPSN